MFVWVCMYLIVLILIVCTSNCSFWCIMDRLAPCIRFDEVSYLCLHYLIIHTFVSLTVCLIPLIYLIHKKFTQFPYFLFVLDQVEIWNIWSLFQRTELLLEDGLELGLCHSTGKGHGRLYFFIASPNIYTYIQEICSSSLSCWWVYQKWLYYSCKQEWPICVCYGAVGGYIVGQTVSLSLIVFLRKHKNLKLA